MLSRTLGLIKPDAFEGRRVGKVLTFIEDKSQLRIAFVKMEWLTLERAKEFYAENSNRPSFDRVTKFMASGPVLAMRLESQRGEAWQIWRGLLVHVRNQFRGASMDRNSAHGSDSAAAAERELAFFGLL